MRKTRTMLQRAQEIFKKIEFEGKSFPKSRLKDIGFSPETAEKWLELIIFIQKQPKIRLVKTARNTQVERVGGKFSQMSMKYFLDETQPLEIRLKSLGDYANSIIAQQRFLKLDKT